MTPLLKQRLRAAGFHLLFSTLVAAATALAVFQLWYPWPYSEVSGGIGLFVLVCGVDLVLGPLITLVIFDKRKPRKELWRDMSVVVVLQLAGLIYGAHTVFIARPVVLALEVDRFRAVIADSVVMEEMPKAAEEFRHLSLTGPRLLNTREANPGDEKFDAIMSAAAGADLGMRPSFWRPWDATARAASLKVAKPVSDLQKRYPAQAVELNAAVAKTGKPIDQLLYIPLLARRTDWSVLIDKATGDPVGFVPLDGF